jgi:hypothetical protein
MTETVCEFVSTVWSLDGAATHIAPPHAAIHVVGLTRTERQRTKRDSKSYQYYYKMHQLFLS